MACSIRALTSSCSLGPVDLLNREKYKTRFQEINKEFKNTFKNKVEDLIDDPAAELLRGTTKLTHHIKGYSGFIPSNVENQKIRDQVFLQKNREHRRKENILDNYSKHIPGYSGFQPRY